MARRRSGSTGSATEHVAFTLRRTPLARDESRESHKRIRYRDGLGVYNDIDEAARKVSVLFVGPTRRR